MRPDIEPKKLKRKLYISYFQDGLWDVVLGLFLLGWGFAVWFDLGWLPGATFVAFFWLALGIKQKVSYSRIGYARPAEHVKQKARFLIAGIVLFLLGVMAFILAITGGTPPFLREYFELIFGTVLAVVVGLIGLWWGIVRWYIYAGLMFISAVFNQWLGLTFELSFIIPGAVVLFSGLVILVRFLRRYPVVLRGA